MTRSSLRSFFRGHRSSLIIHCALLVIGVILAAPLLQTAPLCTDDGALHLYRTVALDRAVRDGLLYPRWFPDLAYGYGFPFFNYREPFGYYLIEFVHLLGASFSLALNLVLAGSLIASGLTMNWWVSDIFDQPAGFVAAIVYMAAPYTLIDALVRGNLPEAIALALMPLILWAFRRLLLHGRRKYFALAVLSLAALLLTHNISSLIFAPVLIIYVFVLRIAHATKGEQMTRYSLRMTLFAFILAVALTAFFWLPALSEGQAAQLYLTHSARGNDYHFNFATIGEVFSPPAPSDPLWQNPPLRIALGWAQIALAVLGVLFIRRLSSREQRAHVILAALLAVIFILMALPLTLPVWDALPLIRFVQFPWRFVGRAILPISLLAGAGTYCVWRGTYSVIRNSRTLLVTRYSLLLIFTLPVLLSAAPQLYPRVCPGKPDPNILDLFAYEHATGHIGIDPLGAYLPVTVVEHPTGSALEAQYAAQEPIKRFDRAALPAGAQVVAETYRPNFASLELSSPIGFRATYLAFDFPGWQVTIDGQPLPIIPSDPNGLITFDVPAGQHQLEVQFGDTPVHTATNAISLAALIVLAGVLVSWPRAAARGMNPAADIAKPDESGSNVIFQPSAFILVPVVFLLLKVLLIDPQLTPLRQTRLQNGTVQGVEHTTQIDFGDQLRLLGYTVSPGSAPAGETVRLDLYWQALRPLDKNYQTTAGLVDANGEVWSPKTLDRPRDYQDYAATFTWPPGTYVVDSFELPSLPGTPPGQYAIYAEAFERGSLRPLPAQASALHPLARPSAAIIGSLDVTHATRSFDAAQLGIYNARFDQALAPELKLLGVNWDRSEALSGETVLLTLFWQTAQPIAEDYFATLELVNEQGASIVRQAFPVGGGHYPTTQWQANEQIIDLDRMRVPPGVPSGLYRWRVSLGRGEPIELGEVRVSAPERSFEMPKIEQRIDQTLGNRVTLLGFENSECRTRNSECRVKLWWRAEANLPESYKVCVHLLDANGVPRAQADVIPANGARPTWSWLPPEIIADEVVVRIPADLPAGIYQLTTGLYGEADGKRLTLPDGKDAIELTTIEVH